MNPLATEFFHALQDLMLAGDPPPQRAHSCRWCDGTGEREDGGACPYHDTSDGEPDEPGDDLTTEQMLRNMGVE